MKKIFFIATVAMVAGCSQKPDPRVAELEKKVTVLENQISALSDQNKAIVEVVGDEYMAQTNQNALFANEIGRSKPAVVVSSIDPQTGLPVGNAQPAIDPATGLPITEDEKRLSRLEMQYSNLVMTINGKNPAASQ